MGRIRGYEGNKPLLGIGEQVWAKPLMTKEWQKKNPLQARWVAGTWVGQNPKTGEHILMLAAGAETLASKDCKAKACRGAM